jgi:hypothetical protein
MLRKALILMSVLLLISTAGFAQKKLTLKQIKNNKAQIVKLQKEVNRLKLRLKKAKTKQLKLDIKDKLSSDQAKIVKIKNILYPKFKPKLKKKMAKLPVRPPTAEAMPSLEAGPEESLSREAVKTRRIGVNYEAGLHGGVFAGTGGFFVGARVPLGLVLGPAVTALRLSAGLAQTMSGDRRYVPVSLDLVLNFPPGFFSGVENYLGGGLNYAARTNGGQGTVGGELFYGVQSEGFGGIVFGELGFAILRSGFAPSSSGLIVMIGFREPLGF